MLRRRSRQPRLGDRRPAPPASSSFLWASLFPALVAIFLCVPCLRLGYLWDDYYFLTFREHGDYRAYLLPDPQAAFYRPVTQGLYFLLLRFADPTNGTLGHVLNLAALAGVVFLLALLVSQLSGPRAGLISGLVLASYGLAPGLVAWVSCSQDLLAAAFVLAAFLLRHQGKDIAALACATAAVLCKEPAIAAFPVLILWDRLVGRPASRPWFQIIGYAIVTLVWALIHPGVHLLASRGFQSGAAGYVGIEHPERWGRYLLRYVMTLVNLPPPGFSGSWWDDRVKHGLAALAILVVGFLIFDRSRPHHPSKLMPLARVAGIATLVGIPTLLMPTILIRHWAPYFAFIPAVALAMLLGPLVAKRPTPVVLTSLAVFLLLGIRYRGIATEQEPVWTERVFAEAASAVGVVRANFHTLFPSFPRGSQVVVSVSSTGIRGIHSTLIDGQALRVWYRDPTIQTVTTLGRRPGAPVEYLARVTSDLDVISIDPDTHRIRSTTPYAPVLDEIGRPIVNYARAVAASGDTDRAVRIMEDLAQVVPVDAANYSHRISAMFLLAAGRRQKAVAILAAATAISREEALLNVKRLLGEASHSEALDEAAFEAFGLSSTDPDAIRWIMREFQGDGALAQAAWYAQRITRLVSGDTESTDLIRATERMGLKPRRTPG